MTIGSATGHSPCLRFPRGCVVCGCGCESTGRVWCTAGLLDNCITVKSLHIFMLVMLALLLPLRGAVAAGIPCCDEHRGATQPLIMEHSSDHHHAAQTEPGSIAAHQHGHSAFSDQPDSVTTAHAGNCNTVSSCCTVSPMLSTLPTIEVPVGVSRQSFPTLPAPAATFHCEAHERPPRSA